MQGHRSRGRHSRGVGQKPGRDHGFGSGAAEQDWSETAVGDLQPVLQSSVSEKRQYSIKRAFICARYYINSNVNMYLLRVI